MVIGTKESEACYMESQLATLYGELAQQLDSMIPVEWEKIYCLGEVEKGKSSWGAAFYFVCVQRSWTTLTGVSPVVVIASEPCSQTRCVTVM